MKPKLTDWPVLKQVLRGDPHASAETASSDRTRALNAADQDRRQGCKVRLSLLRCRLRPADLCEK